MPIILTPEQQKALEAEVAAGRFASMEDALDFALTHFPHGDHSDEWVKPYLEEARKSLAAQGGLTLEEFNARMTKYLDNLR